MPRQSIQPSVKTTKQDRRRKQREEQLRQAALRRAARTQHIVIGVSIAIVMSVTIASFAFFANRNAQNTTATQPAATATPAPTSTSTGNLSSLAPAVDNIQCNSSEQLAYHIHVHLSIYISGEAVPVSESIGITSSCIYWLHTHDTSGVIHIESPTQKTYTLGNFLDLWQQQFSQLHYPTQLDQASGWQIYVDGKLVTSNLRALPLTKHTLITLAYQSLGIKPDSVFNWGDL